MYNYSIKSENPFSFDLLYKHPGDLKKYDNTTSRKRICVIGGGISGLVATYELKKLGHKVQLFEATDRCGGRIKTHCFGDGTYGEHGAMRIPENHYCTLKYINELGLSTRKFVNYNSNCFYHVRNIKTRISEWRNLLPAFKLREHELANPLTVYESVMKKAMLLLTTQDKWSIFSEDTLSSKLRIYDKESLWQYLSNLLSQEAIEYIGHTTGMLQYEKASFLETLIDYFGLFRVTQYEIVGGAEKLIYGLVDKVKLNININCEVKSIFLEENKAVVLWGKNHSLFDKSYYKQNFDFVICTIPAPAINYIDFLPSLPTGKVQAQSNITYASAAKTIVHCKKRFWELNNNIYGGGSFTDLLIQQCWYPSDNAKPKRNSRKIMRFTGNEAKIYKNKDDNSIAPYDWEGLDNDISNSPGVFTAAYMWENNARKFISLDEAQRDEVVIKNVKKLHPEIEKYIDDISHISWDQQKTPGFGAFAYFYPGEHHRYQKELCLSFPEKKPKVFFAGEHLSIAHAWIQGAIQSSLISVMEVIKY